MLVSGLKKNAALILSLVILTLFLVVLTRYMWIEESFALFVLPALLVLVPLVVFVLVIRIFKKIPYRRVALVSLWVVSGLQILVLGVIVWSMYPRSFTRAQLFDDIDGATSRMEDIHPQLFATIERGSFSRIVAEAKTAAPEILSEDQGYRIATGIFAALGDAHTEVSLDTYLRRGAVLFGKVPPYRFRVHNDRLYVLKNYYFRRNIPVGSEIISINGKTGLACVQEVGELISHETTAYRDATLQLPAYWGIWNAFGDYEITYRTPANEVKTIQTGSGLTANLRYLWDFTGFWMKNHSFRVLDGNIGYVDLRAFNNPDGFKDFLRSTFREIEQRGITNLIIDIRKNAGGRTDLAEEMMQYISAGEFHVFDSSKIKISDELISLYSIDTEKFAPGSLVEEMEGEETPLRENPYRFEGQCRILTGGYTFSTALDFAAMIRCFGVGELVGTETGGRTVSYGSPHGFTMPTTGLHLKVSRKKFINACGVDSERGLIPEHLVENSIKDDIQGVDRALEKAINSFPAN
jgi:Peptidase family S41